MLVGAPDVLRALLLLDLHLVDAELRRVHLHGHDVRRGLDLRAEKHHYVLSADVLPVVVHQRHQLGRIRVLRHLVLLLVVLLVPEIDLVLLFKHLLRIAAFLRPFERSLRKLRGFLRFIRFFQFHFLLRLLGLFAFFAYWLGGFCFFILGGFCFFILGMFLFYFFILGGF